MAISHKHPWEYKQEAKSVQKPTKEEFEKLNALAIKKNEKDIIKSPYTMIGGVPHKFCPDTGWIPLTKIN